MELMDIEGKRLVLRELREEEAAQVCEWRNHPDMSRLFYRQHIEPGKYVDWMREIKSDPAKGLYGIVERGGGLLGTLAFELRDGHGGGREAVLGIMIGGSAQRGQGFGREAIDLLSANLAQRHSVDTIVVEVFSHNTAAISFYEKLGFHTRSLEMTRPVGKPD